MVINIINVYSPCALNEKRILYILNLKRKVGDRVWCIIEDFNPILNSDERVGSSDSSQRRYREMVEFNAFIDHMEVVELPSVGRKFTWVTAAGGAMSRLNRALVSFLSVQREM